MKPRFAVILFAVIFSGILFFAHNGAHAASLSLSLPDGAKGSVVTADIGFADAAEVASFSVALSYPTDGDFFTSGAFSKNSTFLPSVPVGTENANFSLSPDTGVFCVVGLKPPAATGAASIGSLPLTVSDLAEKGDERVVTLTGQAYMSNGQVVDLMPVSVLFTVRDGTLQPGQCPQCSGSPVNLTNVTFDSSTPCQCSDGTSITIGEGVTVKPGTTVIFIAPKVNVAAGARFENGADVVIKNQ